MPRRSFAGALLIGLGALLLLHGSSFVQRYRLDAESSGITRAVKWDVAVQGLGGLVLAAGFVLGGLSGRRE